MGPFEWAWVMSLMAEYEAEHIEDERRRDAAHAFEIVHREPDFYSERTATDPYWPPAGCIWWEDANVI